MKRVIEMSKAWIAALVFGIVLTGCGGGSADESGAQQQSSLQGSAILSWIAPGERQNGDKMFPNELAGYVISYGQDPENLDQTVFVSDSDAAEDRYTYTVQNLPSGTWYFTVQAEDSNGLMSSPSELVSKTI